MGSIRKKVGFCISKGFISFLQSERQKAGSFNRSTALIESFFTTLRESKAYGDYLVIGREEVRPMNLDVIQKMIERKEDVHSFPKKWDSLVREKGFLDRKQAVIFFIRDIEKPSDTSAGVFITEKNFYQEFAKLTLKGLQRVFCIEYTNNSRTITSKWETITSEYRGTQRSFLFVDPDFPTWDKVDIEKNLVPLVKGIKKSELVGLHLTILGEIKERRRPKLSSNELIEVLKTSLGIKYAQVFFFDREVLKEHNKSMKTKVQNYLHDRYLFTDTLQFISCHSWKKIDKNFQNQRPVIKQNSQVIVLPALNRDVLKFTYFKLKSYWELIEFAQTASNEEVQKVSTYNFKNPLFNLIS